MFPRLKISLPLLVLGILILSGCTGRGRDALLGSDSQSAEAAYCTQNGGEVETRFPYYGTNNANPLRLAGSMEVCVFTDSRDGSQIMVATDTLYTDQPTLAATSYLSGPPLEPGQPSVNPSSLYCTQLGGSDLFGGVNAAGGGWGKAGAVDVISMCVFPDLSSIDSWGLTYHSDGTIRGADLTDLLRYQPD
jgi:putative hemolysin